MHHWLSPHWTWPQFYPNPCADNRRLAASGDAGSWYGPVWSFELLQPPEMELDYAAVRTYAHAAGPYRDIDVEQEAKHSAWAGVDNVKLST